MIRFIIGLIGASALAQQIPVPPLAVPTVSDARVIVARTNAAGDTVLTVIIPKPKVEFRHYYGIANVPDRRIEYLGLMSFQMYQEWANMSTTVLGGSGPQVANRWLTIFSTTNQIDATLVHSKPCL